MKKVNTIDQFKILQWLEKQNVDLDMFDIVLIDRSTIKLIDKKGQYLFFRYDGSNVIELETI